MPTTTDTEERPIVLPAGLAWRVGPVYYLRHGDVVVAQARQDGELNRPLTVDHVTRDSDTGTYAISWLPSEPWNHTGWMDRETVYVFARPER